jgi:hypothetical protein
MTHHAWAEQKEVQPTIGVALYGEHYNYIGLLMWSSATDVGPSKTDIASHVIHCSSKGMCMGDMEGKVAKWNSGDRVPV